MPKQRDYGQYVASYQAGTPSSELARAAGMNPGQMYRGLRSLGVEMRGRSAAGKGRPMPKGEANANFKGGTFVDKDGYFRVRGAGMNALEHRLIAEGVLGRKLKAGEVVHHINGDRQDNRKENLLICTASYHRIIHARQGALEASGNPSFRQCIYCHQYDSPAAMSIVKTKHTSYHKACAATYQRTRK